MENELVENTDKSLERFSKGQDMQACDVKDGQTLMRDAFPLSVYKTATAACWHAYRKLKLKSERRARAIWNGEARRMDAWEMDALRRAAWKEAHRERQRTLDKIAALESLLMASDPDFHVGSIEALQQQTRGHD